MRLGFLKKVVRRCGRRSITVMCVVLIVLTVIGVAVYRIVRSPISQPCLDVPEGADPGPIAVEGRASGRPGPLTLAFGGDAMLGRGVNDRLGRGRSPNIWRGLAPALRGADVVAFNLECAVTDASPWGSWKKYRFKLLMEHAQPVLSSIPVPDGVARVVSVANNHVLDFGPEGLTDTLGVLDEAGIVHVGAGVDATSAWRPSVITTEEGVRVGFLAVADHCGCLRMSQWVAGRDQPGIAWANLSSGRTEVLLAAVAALDPAVDVLIVSIHGGGNYLPEGLAPWMRQLAEELVDAGADVIWGHSAHHVLPIEQIRGRHVIYGTGGLVDDYVRRPAYRNDLGMVVRITFSTEGTQTAEVVPIRIREQGPSVIPSNEPDYADVLRRARGD